MGKSRYYAYVVGDIVRVKHFDNIVPTNIDRSSSDAEYKDGWYFDISKTTINLIAEKELNYVVAARTDYGDNLAYRIGVFETEDREAIGFTWGEEMLELVYSEPELDIEVVPADDIMGFLGV